MKTLARDTRLSGLRWLTFKGSRREVFSDLGRLCAAEIQAVQAAMPEREGLRRWRDSPEGTARYDRLLATVQSKFADELNELEAMAHGAGVDVEDLFLANIRGDIGSHDGTGCTDLVWRRKTSFVAHNEDGAPGVGSDLMFLSLHIDNEQPVGVQWYPGFVPSNAFAATASGLIWGINHLPISHPGEGAGRHFVARALQRATSLDEAVEFLESTPMAGGFNFNIGQVRTGDIAVVEAAADLTAVHRPHHGDPFAWHTNHILRLPEELASGTQAEVLDGTTAQLGQISESKARGDFLTSLPLPEMEPDAGWFAGLLSGAELPEGVLRTARGTDPLATLCTTVADLQTGCILVRGSSDQPDTLNIEDLVAG